MQGISFQEDHISQLPALMLLEKLGYTYLTPDEALAMRGGKTSNVLLEEVLRNQLRRINSIRVNRNKEELFSEQNIENGVLAMRNIPMEGGYLSGNEAVYNLLTLGKAFEQSIDGDKKSYTMRFIDWERPERNVYHVTEEFAVTRTGMADTYRPDIVLFVNGIPLVVIECKRPDIKGAIDQAISQHLRNQKDDGIRSLYLYSALLLSIGTSLGAYGTTGTPAKFWTKWREMFVHERDGEEYARQLDRLVNEPLSEAQMDHLFGDRFRYVRAHFEALAQERVLPTEQDRYLFSLCRPERLLDLIHNFTVYDGGIKKLARYQQYFTVKEIVARVRTLDHGKRQGGVVWHTQGSGKSLTMVLLAQAIAQLREIPGARIVMVTDRTDLDSQITNTFKKCGREVMNATTGTHLVELLEGKSDAVITTVINKFETAVKHMRQPLTDPNIFILIDEAHRSQYKEMAIKMDKVLPNACKIAFTGTPLMKKEKNTARTFGGIIRPVYTVRQAVEDGAVVPLLYEGRIVPQQVHEGPIDEFFTKVCEGLNEYQTADLKKKYSRTDFVNQTDQRVYSIAWDISEHFRNNWQGTKFKAMLVTPRKSIAVLYKKYLDEIGLVSSDVLITAPDTREGEESSYGDTSEEVKAYWNRMMDEHGTPKKYQDNLIARFKNQEHPEIMIVVDKLLTGFDEPKVVVMYLDRKLNGHTLLQAVARVNRVCDDKEFGYIVDYYGVLKELDDALELYSNYDAEEQEAFRETLEPVDTEIAKLPQRYSDLWELFKAIPNKRDLEAYAQSLREEDRRQEFYERLTAYASCLKIALSTREFHERTPEAEVKRYKDDLNMFVKLRSAVQLRYSDAIDYRQYESQIQKLINRHVESCAAKPVTELVNIFDTEAFEQEVERLESKAAKADTIASRTSKFITENMDTDPAFYKKFSQLLKETIAAYEQGRIDEVEYLQRVSKYKDDVLAHTDNELPDELQQNNAGKAYYGLALETYRRAFGDTTVDLKQLALDTARAFDNIMNRTLIVDGRVLVDWQQKADIIGRMKIALEDYLIDEVKRRYGLVFSFDDMDTIIDGCVEVAKLWIR
ncbi:type I restriction endonuclease subunit R [Barnesiella viscericola]|uniref:type I restriction endonuclease subunit R n=1 Tax=Barnesiella viscericola TaxID=397865 RepID=UPI0025A41AA4|nr:type I restriction endonuclease subunit R [Barnesiella viscericola]MDM8269170.1 type I restriction endonuclease subunit R [Barnesiella viscericola]